MDQQITISEEGGSDTLLQEVAVPGQNNVTEITWMIDRSGPGDHLHNGNEDCDQRMPDEPGWCR